MNGPTAPQSVPRDLFRPGADSDATFAAMVALLDLQDAARPVRRLRDWALTVAQPVAGERAVDVGSGTGTVTREMAALVAANGSALGVEPNARLRELAQERSAAVAGVRFVDGLATALPLEDASVDLVWCERVLQHLDDPQAAVSEMARVLRPGGRALLLDSDWGSLVVSTMTPEVQAALLLNLTRENHNPFAGRHILGQATAAGLVADDDVGSAAMILPSRQLVASGMLANWLDPAVRVGGLSREVADVALRASGEAIERGDFFGAVTMYAFCIRKPG